MCTSRAVCISSWIYYLCQHSLAHYHNKSEHLASLSAKSFSQSHTGWSEPGMHEPLSKPNVTAPTTPSSPVTVTILLQSRYLAVSPSRPHLIGPTVNLAESKSSPLPAPLTALVACTVREMSSNMSMSCRGRKFGYWALNAA
jgi:hypothetical protein